MAIGGDIELHPEADAIIGVIRDCLSAIRQKDFEAWADFWVQAPHVRRIGTQSWCPANLAPFTGLLLQDGWDDIRPFMKRMLGDQSAVIFPHGTHCENWSVRVRADTAWVTFDQYLLDANGRHAPEITGVSREMRMLEKHADGWKFNYMGFFHEHLYRIEKPMVRVDEYAAISGMTRTAAEKIASSEALLVRNGRLRGVDQDVDKRLSGAIRKSARTTSWDSTVHAPVLVSTPWGAPECICWIAPSLDALNSAVILLDDVPTSRRRLHNAIIVYRLSGA